MFNFNVSGKVQQAEEHIRQAETYLKTSWTKWKPDIDSAIDEFDKACNCYRVAEKHELCRDLSIRLAELQIEKGYFMTNRHVTIHYASFICNRYCLKVHLFLLQNLMNKLHTWRNN
jgi:hypothetical protein